MAESSLSSPKVQIRDSLDDILEYFCSQGWTDGLPIIPPTEELVRQMLAATKRQPGEVLGAMATKMGEATVEKVAINAVMAGCLPSYMPVLLAAVEAILDNAFQLYSMQPTTNPATPLAVVNGPIRKELDINSGSGCFGPGWRANATIGRAIRLILLNIGGGTPGVEDKATNGHPGKYTYCIGENEEANPWEPLHVERSFPRESSTVTMFCGSSLININDHEGNTALHILTIAVDTMSKLSSFLQVPIFILCPEHAATIAGDGWSKEEVKRYLFEHIRLPLWRHRLSSHYTRHPRWGEGNDPHALIPMSAEHWQQIVVLVAGGPGKHSSYIPSIFTPGVTKPIER